MNELIKHTDRTIDTQELLKMVNDARKRALKLLLGL